MTPQQLFRAKVSRNLHNMRRGKRISQDAFARTIGCHRNTVSRWELGEAEPTLWDCVMIAYALEMGEKEFIKEVLA